MATVVGLLLVSSLVVVTAATPAAGAPKHPVAVTHAELLRGGGDAALAAALAADGVVVVEQIVGGLDTAAVLGAARACMDQTAAPMTHVMEDGAVRTSLAAASTATALDKVDHDGKSEACAVFDSLSEHFRQTVSTVVATFSERLQTALRVHASLLRRKTASRHESSSYGNLQDLVAAAPRLEHFHVYTPAAATTTIKEDDGKDDSMTLDMHVDQGLFIAFVPAVPSSRGFYVRGPDGSDVELLLPTKDALVFLAGDTFNKLHSKDAISPVRPPLHGLRMAKSTRMWYGMMVLPPNDAIDEDTIDDATYGTVRHKMTLGDPSSIGCSGRAEAKQHGQCDTNTSIYCWYRCMPVTPTANASYCASQNMGFNCVSQFDEVYVSGHGDFNPACTNSTTLSTEANWRPAVPQPNTTALPTCEIEWASLLNTNHTHTVALYPGQTYLLWTVVPGPNNAPTMDATVIHKGVNAWSALGLENVGCMATNSGCHYGMNGATILMGLDYPDEGTEAHEFLIDASSSAFRHWKTPLAPSAGLGHVRYTVTECASVLDFSTSHIGGQPLDFTPGAVNRLIWAQSKQEYATKEYGGYAPYHGATDRARSKRPQMRGHVKVDLTTGQSVNRLDFDDFWAYDAGTWTSPSASLAPDSSSDDKSSTVLVASLLGGVAAVALVAAVAYKANNRASSIWSNDRSTVGTTVKPEAEPSKPATSDPAAVTTIEIGPVVGQI